MAANSVVNRGIVELRTEAVPLSMCSSAQAMRVNGSTTPISDHTATLNQKEYGQRRRVLLIAITAPTARTPKNMRPSATSRGDVSSTITLMKRKEAPQVAPSASRVRNALGFTLR